MDDTGSLTGQDLKKAGQAIVLTLSHDWVDVAFDTLRKFCRRRKREGRPEFVFEEFRYFCWSAGMKQPRSPNAWGALSSRAESCGLIKKTGKTKPARSLRTHGHSVNVWSAL